MRGDVTDAGRRRRQTKSEDRATQPMEAGGWVSQYKDRRFINFINVQPPIWWVEVVRISSRPLPWGPAN